MRHFTRLFDYPMYTLVPTANWHLMIKYGEVIDILGLLLSDFRALKNVCAKTAEQRH